MDASGNRINDKSTNVLDIATSVASNNQGTQNVLFVHGKGGSGNFGGNTYAGAYTMSVAKDNASTKLTTTTLPNKKIYTVSGNVGAVTRLSYQLERLDYTSPRCTELQRDRYGSRYCVSV